MNIDERKKMILAMEYIARQINDEEVFEEWLMDGVADGDITAFDMSEVDDYYINDKTFASLMGTFVHIISRARKSGGLYCDGVVDDVSI